MVENQNSILEIPKKQKRIFELDVLRAIAIIAMIIDHFTILVSFSGGYGGWASFIFSNYSEINNPFMNSFIKVVDAFQDSSFRLICHYIFVTIFLAICGISCTFSRSNFKRAAKIIGASLIIAFVTTILSLISGEELYIIFGILMTIGFSIIIYEIIVRIYDNKWFLLIIGLVIILWGFLIEWWKAPYVDSIKDMNFINCIKMILGYVVFGNDCFGLIPCTGVVLIGGFLGKTIYQKRTSLIPKLDGKWHKPLTFIGTHTLWIYLLHQVISVVVILIIYLFCGYRF